MQYSYSFMALVALAASASAVTLPACAQTCINSAVAAVTTCGATDYACICTTSNQNLIIANATPCVLKNCDAADISTTLADQSQVCPDLLASASSVVPTTSAPVSVAPTTSAPVSVAPTTTPASSVMSSVMSSVASTTAAVTSAPVSSSMTTKATSVASASMGNFTQPAPFTGAAAPTAAAAWGGAILMGAAALAAL